MALLFTILAFLSTKGLDISFLSLETSTSHFCLENVALNAFDHVEKKNWKYCQAAVSLLDFAAYGTFLYAYYVYYIVP